MGGRFLGVAAVVVHLEQDGYVHGHLQQAAGPELHRSLGKQEVDRLKGVSAGPHQHHLNTGGGRGGGEEEKRGKIIEEKNER